jgi:hypothetical protein
MLDRRVKLPGIRDTRIIRRHELDQDSAMYAAAAGPEVAALALRQRLTSRSLPSGTSYFDDHDIFARMPWISQIADAQPPGRSTSSP